MYIIIKNVFNLLTSLKSNDFAPYFFKLFILINNNNCLNLFPLFDNVF